MPRPNATVATHILALPLKNCLEECHILSDEVVSIAPTSSDTYPALCFFSFTGPHPAVVHYNFAVHTGRLDVLSDNFCINLTPHVHYDTALGEASTRKPILGSRFARMLKRRQESNQLVEVGVREEISLRNGARLFRYRYVPRSVSLLGSTRRMQIRQCCLGWFLTQGRRFQAVQRRPDLGQDGAVERCLR